MTTEQEQIGTLAGQVAYLTYRVMRAEAAIDGLKQVVPQKAFDQIWNKSLGSTADLSAESLSRYSAILREIGLNVDPKALLEAVLKLQSSKRQTDSFH
jgi:hypothetical protein